MEFILRGISDRKFSVDDELFTVKNPRAGFFTVKIQRAVFFTVKISFV